jgi:hypothetical protein
MLRCHWPTAHWSTIPIRAGKDVAEQVGLLPVECSCTYDRYYYYYYSCCCWVAGRLGARSSQGKKPSCQVQSAHAIAPSYRHTFAALFAVEFTYFSDQSTTTSSSQFLQHAGLGQSPKGRRYPSQGHDGVPLREPVPPCCYSNSSRFCSVAHLPRGCSSSRH